MQAAMTGWIVIADVWHYARGMHTLCRRSIAKAEIVRDVMTAKLPNCKVCQQKRLAEVAPRINDKNR